MKSAVNFVQERKGRIYKKYVLLTANIRTISCEETAGGSSVIHFVYFFDINDFFAT